MRFAAKVAEARRVTDDDVPAVKLAGYDDAQEIEILQHAALNARTNYVNEVARTAIDFPVVAARSKAA